MGRLRREHGAVDGPVDVGDKSQVVEEVRPCLVAADVGTVSAGVLGSVCGCRAARGRLDTPRGWSKWPQQFHLVRYCGRAGHGGSCRASMQVRADQRPLAPLAVPLHARPHEPDGGELGRQGPAGVLIVLELAGHDTLDSSSSGRDQDDASDSGQAQCANHAW